MTYSGIIHKYKSLIDIPGNAIPISLIEGNTPLIPAPKIADAIGGDFELWIKFEGLNPTGSFKDRGMTTAVSEARYRGAHTVICASTGNTAASAAAYAARANMRAIVIIPAGKVAAGKLAGAIAYGAEVIQIDGSFDDALSLVIKISEKHPIALVNSLNPFRLQGQKTAAFEICDAIGDAPDILALPVGNAGNITAYWMGFKQYHSIKNTQLPKLLGVQSAGAAPLVVGHPIEHPETIATAIRIGKPARGEEATQASIESGGWIVSASDQEILDAQKMLANSGIWVEPASAAGIAGLSNHIRSGKIEPKGKKIVAVCTGHGLKDPEIVVKNFEQPRILKPQFSVLEDKILNG